MTTPRLFDANRTNARANTGPRSKAGQGARWPQRAPPRLEHRHSQRPHRGGSGQGLARRIVGDGAAPAAMALARAFAEAQIDLDCVRKVRRHVLGRVVADPDDGAEGEVDRSELVRQLRRLERYEHRALARRRRAIFRRWRLAGRNHNEQATP